MDVSCNEWETCTEVQKNDKFLIGNKEKLSRSGKSVRISLSLCTLALYHALATEASLIVSIASVIL